MRTTEIILCLALLFVLSVSSADFGVEMAYKFGGIVLIGALIFITKRKVKKHE